MRIIVKLVLSFIFAVAGHVALECVSTVNHFPQDLGRAYYGPVEAATFREEERTFSSQSTLTRWLLGDLLRFPLDKMSHEFPCNVHW